MGKVKIAEVEPCLAQKLDHSWKKILQESNYSVPSGYRLRVRLLSAKGRKKPGNAAFDNWSPASSDRAEIWLEPCASEEATAPREVVSRVETPVMSIQPGAPAAGAVSSEEGSIQPAEVELLRALDRAESTPGWNFVSLKKFRDEVLPSEKIASLTSLAGRQEVLRSVIDKRLVLTGKVQNPKSPQFPVTSIRVNRLKPEVRHVLGLPKQDLDFHPIHIKGEPLSATIIRERR